MCLGRRRSRRLTLCNFTLRRQMLLVSLPRPHTDRRVRGEHRRRVNLRAISQGTYAGPQLRMAADFPTAVPLISCKNFTHLLPFGPDPGASAAEPSAFFVFLGTASRFKSCPVLASMILGVLSSSSPRAKREREREIASSVSAVVQNILRQPLI